MGADMCVELAVIGEDEEPDFEAARSYIATAVEKDLMRHSRCDELEDLACGDWETVDELRKALRAALASFEVAVSAWHREATRLHRNGEVIYLTGGLSWGDAPTELYDEMALLHETGVMKAAGFGI